jgi:hypothetical protein
MTFHAPADEIVRSRGAGHRYDNRTALIVMTALFFMCGFLATLNDILIPHLKLIFDLTYVGGDAHPVQLCFLISDLCLSLWKIGGKGRVPEDPGVWALHDGNRSPSLHAGRRGPLVCTVHGSFGDAGWRHHCPWGFWESLHLLARFAPHSVQPPEPCPGIQFTWFNDCALGWGCSDPGAGDTRTIEDVHRLSGAACTPSACSKPPTCGGPT